MKIKKFLEENPDVTFDQYAFWAKKFSEIHLPPKDGFSGKTPCGVPMLGNNYAGVAYEEDREICDQCLTLLEFKQQKKSKEISQDHIQPENNTFTQLCVWPGTIVGQSQEEIKYFEKTMAEIFHGTRVKYAEEVLTLPDIANDGKTVRGTGKRNDLFFYVHTDDIGKFAIPRLTYGIRWWEDVLGSSQEKLYPDFEKVPKHLE